MIRIVHALWYVRKFGGVYCFHSNQFIFYKILIFWMRVFLNSNLLVFFFFVFNFQRNQHMSIAWRPHLKPRNFFYTDNSYHYCVRGHEFLRSQFHPLPLPCTAKKRSCRIAESLLAFCDIIHIQFACITRVSDN